jgi:hypothetical protein
MKTIFKTVIHSNGNQQKYKIRCISAFYESYVTSFIDGADMIFTDDSEVFRIHWIYLFFFNINTMVEFERFQVKRI